MISSITSSLICSWASANDWVVWALNPFWNSVMLCLNSACSVFSRAVRCSRASERRGAWRPSINFAFNWSTASTLLASRAHWTWATMDDARVASRRTIAATASPFQKRPQRKSCASLPATVFSVHRSFISGLSWLATFFSLILDLLVVCRILVIGTYSITIRTFPGSRHFNTSSIKRVKHSLNSWGVAGLPSGNNAALSP